MQKPARAPAVEDGARDISAIIVTFYPDRRLLENVRNLDRQVGAILIIDNTPVPLNSEISRGLAKIPKVVTVRNGRNLGLASALNIGAKKAMGSGCRWLAFFDQDSIVAEDFFGRIFDKRDACPYWGKIGILAPKYVDQGTSFEKLFGSKDGITDLRRTVFVPTSGSVVRQEIFSCVGYFDEDFFIDYLDHDFCFRCALKGWLIAQDEDAVLYHSVGRTMSRELLWGRVITSNHSPERIYYRSRNRVVVYLRYFRNFRRWFLGDLVLLAKEMIKIMLFEEKKVEKTVNVSRGAFHALIGRMGRYA